MRVADGLKVKQTTTMASVLNTFLNKNGVPVDLNHRVDVHKVDQGNAALHELDTPPRGRRY